MLPRLVSLRRRPPRLPTHLRLISSHPTPPPASEGPDSVGALSSPSPSPLPSSSPGASPPVRVIVDPPPERYSGPPPSLPHRAPHYAHPVVPSPHKWNLPVAFGGQPQVEMGLQAGPHDDHPLPVVRVGTHTPNSLWQAMVVGNRDTFAKIRWFVGGLIGTAVIFHYLEYVRTEYWDLIVPATLFEPPPLPASPSEDDLLRQWGWELDNQDWTGGLLTGTCMTLHPWTREWVRRAAHESLQPEPFEPPADKRVVGGDRPDLMDGQTAVMSGLADFVASDFFFMNKLDQDAHKQMMQFGPVAAEYFMSRAIQHAKQKGVRVPPIPSPEQIEKMPLPSPIAPTERRPRNAAHEVGQVMLLRHAELVEALADGESFFRARCMYEGLMREIEGLEGCETLEGKLAEKMGRLSALMEGPQARARGLDWLAWGVARTSGWDGTGLKTVVEDVGVSSRQSLARRVVGWRPWKSAASTAASISPPPSPSPPSDLPATSGPPTTTDPAALAVAPSTDVSSAAQKPTASSLTLISHLPPLPSLLPSDPSLLPPCRLRTLATLLSTLSHTLSAPSTLPLAQSLQLASLTLLDDALSSHTTSRLALADAQRTPLRKMGREVGLDSANSQLAVPTGPDEVCARLHEYTLELERAVIGLHLAETSYALGRQTSQAGGEEEQTNAKVVRLAERSLRDASRLVFLLSSKSWPSTPEQASLLVPAWSPYIPPSASKIPTSASSHFGITWPIYEPSLVLLARAASLAGSASGTLGLLSSLPSFPVPVGVDKISGPGGRGAEEMYAIAMGWTGEYPAERTGRQRVWSGRRDATEAALGKSMSEWVSEKARRRAGIMRGEWENWEGRWRGEWEGREEGVGA